MVDVQLSTLGSVIKTAYEAQSNTNAYTDLEKSKLAAIEASATADQTGAEIKALYEAESDTNAFDDAAVSKLAGIEDNATADQSAAEIAAMTQDWRGSGSETLIAATTALEAASSGISDGDKGDITVSGSGATWTVDNSAITNAKLANVATATIKGRVTASTGVVEDLTATQVRTLINVADGANVSKVGTPVDNQVGVWTGDGTIEGDGNLVWTGSELTVTGDVRATGIGIGRSPSVTLDMEASSVNVRLRDTDAASGGYAQITSGSTAPLRLQADVTGVESFSYITFEVDGNEYGRIDDNGDLAITGNVIAHADIIDVSSSRALALTDKSSILEIDTSGGAVVITIPTNASVAFPIGTIINFTLVDPTSTASITGDTGVTLNGVSAGSGDLDGNAWDVVSIYKRATDEWVVNGNIGAVA